MALAPRILVISTAVDPATDFVVKALDRLGAEVTRVDTETYPYELHATFALTEQRARPAWGEGFGSIWYRRIRSPGAPSDVPADVHDYCCQEAKTFVVGSVLGSRCPAMSDPYRVWAAENKLFQLRIAQGSGLDIPATVITNDPAEVRRFFDACSGRLVVKPLRSGYVEIAGQPHAVFTSRVREEHLAHLGNATPCPSIYQVLVDKDCDVRVTYVDGELFSAEIDSQSDPDATVDWRRTANPDLPHRPVKLPDELATRISDFMNRLGLVFGALDFIRTPGGAYVFLEVNPNGQWLWLEDRLEFPISDRIASWLVTRARGE